LGWFTAQLKGARIPQARHVAVVVKLRCKYGTAYQSTQRATIVYGNPGHHKRLCSILSIRRNKFNTDSMSNVLAGSRKYRQHELE
jgi:hypothetical protein